MAGSGTCGRYGNVARAIQIRSKPHVHDHPDPPDGGYGIGLGATGGSLFRMSLDQYEAMVAWVSSAVATGSI